MKDLKAFVEHAHRTPEGKGDMVLLYGMFYNHSASAFELTMLQVWAVQAQ